MNKTKLITSLKRKWLTLCAKRGASKHQEDVFDDLIARYAEPHRRYHVIGHIAHMLKGFESLEGLAKNPEAIEFAIWFHDAVYDTQAKDNEAKSAELAVEAAQKLGLPDKFANEVRRLILATEHKDLPQDTDAKIVVDLDLASLASEPAVFDKNSANIRFEYGWVPEAIFNAKRAEFAEGMLKRQRIFSLPAMKEKYEAKARANLKRHVADLTA
jgi:predicted metal-dependent HD superfamily phosphohydrolase